MNIAGQALTKQFHRGRVEIELDLPKGESLKSAQARLIVNRIPVAEIKLKKGKNSFTYYSQSGHAVTVAVQGEMRNNQSIFSEEFHFKGGETEPTRIRLTFSKPAKVKKSKLAKAKRPKAALAPAPVPQPEAGAPPTMN